MNWISPKMFREFIRIRFRCSFYTFVKYFTIISGTAVVIIFAITTWNVSTRKAHKKSIKAEYLFITAFARKPKSLPI